MSHQQLRHNQARNDHEEPLLLCWKQQPVGHTKLEEAHSVEVPMRYIYLQPDCNNLELFLMITKITYHCSTKCSQSKASQLDVISVCGNKAGTMLLADQSSFDVLNGLSKRNLISGKCCNRWNLTNNKHQNN